MALVFKDKITGEIRRYVMDAELTDEQLEAVHLPLDDETRERINVKIEDFNLS